jgi:hypothetical protein
MRRVALGVRPTGAGAGQGVKGRVNADEASLK